MMWLKFEVSAILARPRDTSINHLLVLPWHHAFDGVRAVGSIRGRVRS